MNTTDFQDLLRQKANELYRAMPWRTDTRAYYVLVSELMLQQTQVARVVPKFTEFIAAFPNEQTLAAASLGDVLKLWQGLGYNRRAKYLYDAAKKIVQDFDGVFPENEADIQSLPGVGPNTAGAIVAYAFNQPSIFIETNIRTVYIHHFFADNFDVTDKQIKEKLQETIDTEHPREFYWGLMDYGSSLKTNGVKNIARSKHYKKQSPLLGSIREVRGHIVKELTRRESMSYAQLEMLHPHDIRVDAALASLKKDGILAEKSGIYHLTKH